MDENRSMIWQWEGIRQQSFFHGPGLFRWSWIGVPRWFLTAEAVFSFLPHIFDFGSLLFLLDLKKLGRFSSGFIFSFWHRTPPLHSTPASVLTYGSWNGVVWVNQRRLSPWKSLVICPVFCIEVKNWWDDEIEKQAVSRWWGILRYCLLAWMLYKHSKSSKGYNDRYKKRHQGNTKGILYRRRRGVVVGSSILINTTDKNN